MRSNQSWTIAHCLVVLDYPELFAVTRVRKNLDELNDAGDSPVHLAMKLKRLTCLKALIEAGARLDVLDSMGNSPFHLAALLGMEYMQPLASFKFSPLVNMLNDKLVKFYWTLSRIFKVALILI
jgi:ankyrin repeat protein